WSAVRRRTAFLAESGRRERCVITTIARVSGNRRKDRRTTGTGSRDRHDRFSYTTRPSGPAVNCALTFPAMSHLLCRASAAADAEQYRSASHRVAVQYFGTLFLGMWRAFAVVFFSPCALVHSAISIPFVRRDRRLHTRAVWLHRWCRFACRVLGIRVRTQG